MQEDYVSGYYDGVEDPRIVKSADNEYFMTYTSFDGKAARFSIPPALYVDLISCTKKTCP